MTGCGCYITFTPRQVLGYRGLWAFMKGLSRAHLNEDGYILSAPLYIPTTILYVSRSYNSGRP